MTPTIYLHDFISWSNEGVLGELWGAATHKIIWNGATNKINVRKWKVPSEMVNCAIHSQIVPPLASFAFPLDGTRRCASRRWGMARHQTLAHQERQELTSHNINDDPGHLTSGPLKNNNKKITKLIHINSVPYYENSVQRIATLRRLNAGNKSVSHRFSQKWQLRVCKWNFRVCKMPV